MFLPNDQLLYFCGTDPECSRLGSNRVLTIAPSNGRLRTRYYKKLLGIASYLSPKIAVVGWGFSLKYVGCNSAAYFLFTGNLLNTFHFLLKIFL